MKFSNSSERTLMYPSPPLFLGFTNFSFSSLSLSDDGVCPGVVIVQTSVQRCKGLPNVCIYFPHKEHDKSVILQIFSGPVSHEYLHLHHEPVAFWGFVDISRTIPTLCPSKREKRRKVLFYIHQPAKDGKAACPVNM